MKRYKALYRITAREVYLLIAFSAASLECPFWVLQAFYYREEAEVAKETLNKEAKRSKSGVTYCVIQKKVKF